MRPFFGSARDSYDFRYPSARYCSRYIASDLEHTSEQDTEEEPACVFEDGLPEKDDGRDEINYCGNDSESGTAGIEPDTLVSCHLVESSGALRPI